MAESVERIVQTIFTVVDKATPSLKQLSSGAMRLGKLFDGASRAVGSFGAIGAVAAGAFSMKHAIEGTMELLTNTKKLTNITGMATSEAGALLDTFEDMGVSTQETTRAITTMSRRGLVMESSIDRAKGGLNVMAKRYKQLGIDVEKGPVAAVKQLATQAQKNNLSAQDLINLYRMAPDTASRFLEVLKKGPGEITKSMEEFKKLNLATKENVERNERIRILGLRIKSAWGDITSVIAVKLLPVIEQVLGQVADKLESWVPKAVKFGETLGAFLRDHLETVKLIGKVMLANFMLMKLTGGGIVANTGKVTGFIKSVAGLFVKGGAAAAAGAGVAAAGAASAGAGAAAGAAGAGAAGAGAGAAGVAAIGLGPILIAVAAIAAVVGLVYAAFKGVKENVEGVRDRLMEAWGRVIAHLKVMGALLKPLFDRVKFTFGKESAIGRFFMTLLPRAASSLLEEVQKIIQGINTVIIFATAVGEMFPAFWANVVYEWKRAEEAILAGWETVKNTFTDRVLMPISEAWQFIQRQYYERFYNPIVKGWWDIVKFYDAYLATPISNSWKYIRNIFKTQFYDPIVKWLQDIMKWLKPRAETSKGFELDLGWMQPAANLLETSWNRAGQMAESVYKTSVNMKRAADQIAPPTKPPAERAAPPHYDFRNSKFDIRQQFAEGFDPDRIAVAFTNDLATLGERKLQSGFSPLYALR